MATVNQTAHYIPAVHHKPIRNSTKNDFKSQLNVFRDHICSSLVSSLLYNCWAMVGNILSLVYRSCRKP